MRAREDVEPGHGAAEQRARRRACARMRCPNSVCSVARVHDAERPVRPRGGRGRRSRRDRSRSGSPTITRVGELGHRGAHALGGLGGAHDDRGRGRAAPRASAAGRAARCSAVGRRASRRAPTGPRGRRPTGRRARCATRAPAKAGLVRHAGRVDDVDVALEPRTRGRARASSHQRSSVPRAEQPLDAAAQPPARRLGHLRRGAPTSAGSWRAARRRAAPSGPGRGRRRSRRRAPSRDPARSRTDPTVRCTPAPPIGGKWRASMSTRGMAVMLGADFRPNLCDGLGESRRTAPSLEGMNLGRHAAVLWRFRRVTAVGVFVGIVLAILASYRVGSGGLTRAAPKPGQRSRRSSSRSPVSPRAASRCRRSRSDDAVTVEGDPAVSKDSEPKDQVEFADPGRLAALGDLYARFLTSDEMLSKRARSIPACAGQASPFAASQGGQLLPVVQLTTMARGRRSGAST